MDSPEATRICNQSINKKPMLKRFFVYGRQNCFLFLDPKGIKLDGFELLRCDRSNTQGAISINSHTTFSGNQFSFLLLKKKGKKDFLCSAAKVFRSGDYASRIRIGEAFLTAFSTTNKIINVECYISPLFCCCCCSVYLKNRIDLLMPLRFIQGNNYK